MSLNFDKIGVIILSAGKGTRLGCVDKPKVMLEIGGKPIVSYLVETLVRLGFKKEQICLVVGFCKEKVMEYFGDRVIYAEQKELKGTAHAAYVGALALPDGVEQVLIMNGDDGAFYTENTLKNFIDRHFDSGATVSLLAVSPKNFEAGGRITKDANDRVIIIEKENLTEVQKKIKEINTNTFCLDKNWFIKMFPDMPPIKKLNEYGLPTVLEMANRQGKKVQAVKLKNNREWFGINTLEELEEARRLKQ